MGTEIYMLLLLAIWIYITTLPEEKNNKTKEKNMEPKDAGPLGVHFEKLLNLKEWIKQEAEKSKDPIVTEIYERLNALIKKEENTNE